MPFTRSERSYHLVLGVVRAVRWVGKTEDPLLLDRPAGFRLRHDRPTMTSLEGPGEAESFRAQDMKVIR